MLSLYHSPFELLDNFEQQFSQIDRTPLAEVVDTNDKYIIRLELPGVVKETIDVKATDKSLTVSANRKNLDDKESRYLFSEFRYGKWNRTFKFNSNLNQKKILVAKPMTVTPAAITAAAPITHFSTAFNLSLSSSCFSSRRSILSCITVIFVSCEASSPRSAMIR